MDLLETPSFGFFIFAELFSILMPFFFALFISFFILTLVSFVIFTSFFREEQKLLI